MAAFAVRRRYVINCFYHARRVPEADEMISGPGHGATHTGFPLD